MQRHDVVVVGSGNAGVSLAARLRRLGCRDVLIVSPTPEHLYRPLLNFVAGGQASLSRLTFTTRSVIPSGCRWRQDEVVAVHPDRSQVETAGGELIGYNDVVLAPGLDEDLDAVPGLGAAMQAGWSTTAHLKDSAEATWAAVRRLRRGRVVFTVPPEPAPCGGSALKPLFLACDHWRREGVLADLKVHLVTPYRSVLDLPFVDATLSAELARFGVVVHHGSVVGSVDHEARQVRLGPSGTGPGEDSVLTDLEHAVVVPPYRAPAWLQPLAAPDDPDGHGLVDIDPHTFAHRTAERVWALGDAAAVRTRPSGGALRRQVDVLADNVRRARLGEQLRSYDGYTIIPITVDRQRLLLAEFDRNGRPQPTLRWPDLTVPSRALFAFDRYLEPLIYRRALLRGRV